MSEGLRLLPVAEGLCVQCATKHRILNPHNFWSMYYKMRFRIQHGRDATQADCVAHLSKTTQSVYREALGKFGRDWTEPPAGVDPIAEPYEKQK